jgi:hypothetical protein
MRALSVALLVLPASLAGAAVRYTGSPAEQEAKSKGTTLVRELDVDVDGDGAREIVVVERAADRTMRVRVLRPGGDEDEPVFQALATSTPRKADRLLRLEARELTGERGTEVVAVLEETSPDELVQHVRILGRTPGGVGELFAQSFYTPRQGAPDARTVELGDATPRFALRELAADGPRGRAELAWVRGPQVLSLPIGKEPAQVVIGAYEQVYRYEAGKGVFVPDATPSVVDFAPARSPYTVEASEQVPKIWGTAQAFWGSDGDLSTAWTAAGPKGGVGASLGLALRTPEEVQLLRIVPGCAGSAAAWASHDRVRAFAVELSSGVRFELDRASWAKTTDVELPRAVRAVGDFPLLGEGGVEVGRQLLVLLRERAPIRTARLSVTQLEPGKPPRGVAREVCVAELSIH